MSIPSVFESSFVVAMTAAADRGGLGGFLGAPARYQRFGRLLRSVSRRSLPLGLFTLTAIEKSFGAETAAGASVGKARCSGPWTSARRVRHFYDCFLATRTHRLDPLQPDNGPDCSPDSRRWQARSSSRWRAMHPEFRHLQYQWSFTHTQRRCESCKPATADCRSLISFCMLSIADCCSLMAATRTGSRPT